MRAALGRPLGAFGLATGLVLLGLLALGPSARAESGPKPGLDRSPGEPAPPLALAPELRAALDAAPTRPISALVFLDPVAAGPSVPDPAAAEPKAPDPVTRHPAAPESADSAADAIPGRIARRLARLDGWRAEHAAARARLAPWLAEETARGELLGVTDLWLAQALIVRASPRALARLEGAPGVRAVLPEPSLRVEGPPLPAPGSAAAALPPGADAAPLWNVRMVRADAVWQRLGLDGSGVTVGIIDTGVDYHHPLLASRYRGYVRGGLPLNVGNWWCQGGDAFCGQGTRYPVDGYGHGSHVAGSILAGEGVGVAPGARWVAARACLGKDCPYSLVVGALQWLLDQAPERQPDVVNFSLGTTDPLHQELYRPVFNRLHAAGVVLVAATGNSSDALQAPASFTSTIGVGAVTAEGRVWAASARGVSAWNEVKPDLVAPGTGITSTVPGGGLQRSTGTSMATPHVSGVVALLLQADPELDPDEVKALLRAHARPLGGARPDPAAGWGLVDAYGAAAAVAQVGQLRGQVRREPDGGLIPWARVTVADELGNPLAELEVGAEDGAYRADLQPGRYLVIARAFGFQTRTERVSVAAGAETRLDFRLLLADPMGTFKGRVLDAQSGAPIAASLQLEGVPFALPSDPVFGFSQNLPPQSYRVRIAELGYRVAEDVIKVLPGETLVRTYSLEPAPRILLVDADAWLFTGAIEAYRAALDRLGYVYDLHVLSDPQAGSSRNGGPPTIEQMAAYDIVIWSHSLSSPNSVRGARELSGYLQQGGRLFLSGQDALCLDAGRDVPLQPCDGGAPPQSYVTQLLRLRVLSDRAAAPATVTGGEDGPLAGITLTLNGPGSLDNQIAPDVLDATDPLQGRVIGRYADGSGAATIVDTCVNHRAIAFGFGFEGIAGADRRAEVMARVIAALAAPAPARGPVLRASATDLARPAGASATYTVSVHNPLTVTTAYSVAIEGSAWPAELLEGGLGRPLRGPIQVPACQAVPFALRVRVPEGTPRGAADTARLRVAPQGGGPGGAIALRTHTPAPVLVVDGDYVAPSEQRYLEGLAAAGVAYDVWELGMFDVRPTLPTSATLAGYPAVVWFSGYDILRPGGSLNLAGQRDLAAYLDAGGRLLFSSQDYLRHWGRTPYRGERLFHRDYLGVADFSDDGGAAHAGPLRGAEGSILAGLEGCRLPYHRPENDFSDQLLPAAQAALLNRYERPVGTQAESPGGFKSLFLALDAGGLDPACADGLIARALDWFSGLTDSSLSLVDAAGRPETRRSFADGDRLNLRLRLHNGGPRALGDAAIEWTLPAGGSPDPATLPGPEWRWDPVRRSVRWRGSLDRFTARAATLGFTLDRDLPAPGAMRSTVRLGAEGITLTRALDWRVNAPDLSASSKSVPDDQRQRRHGQTARFVIHVVNRGTRPVAGFRLTDTLPAGLVLVENSLGADGGHLEILGPRGLAWEGPVLAPGAAAALSYDARVVTYAGGRLRNRALLVDDTGDTRILEASIFALPRLHLPWVGRQLDPDP